MKTERGVALLVAIVVAVLLSLLGLSLTLSSMSEYSMGREFENHERALLVAEAGLNQTKAVLRGKNLSTLLAQVTQVPQYVDYEEPAAGSFAFRNPLAPIEARNIDFDSPPGAVATRSVTGLLTPATGTAIGDGIYFARLTDNSDESVMGMSDDPDADIDNTVYLRVMAIVRGGLSEVASYGTGVKNSVAIIEATLKRDASFAVSSSVELIGPDVVATFGGASWEIDGYDHSGMSRHDVLADHSEVGLSALSGIGAIYDNEGGGDAQAAVDSIVEALTKGGDKKEEGGGGKGGGGKGGGGKGGGGDLGGGSMLDNVTGKGGLPSVNDDTAVLRDDPNPDAMNITDPFFLLNFIQQVAGVADNTYNGVEDSEGSKKTMELGTLDDPKITFVNGDIKLAGNLSGAGLLVVTGSLALRGTFDFDGIILVVGEGDVNIAGATAVIGGICAAKLVQNGDNVTLGTPSFSYHGQGNNKSGIYNHSSNIAMGFTLLPMSTVSWREITPEIEPAE
jgi:uncharacterized membrane protein YgcG